MQPVERKVLRQALIARREALPADQHGRLTEQINALLMAGFGSLSHTRFGFYWPWRAEFDIRPAVLRLVDQGGVAALPVIEKKGLPMFFRRWHPDQPMGVEAHGIACPVGTEVIDPMVVLVPVNGFDANGYRIGYGGGYFDEYLAAAKPNPLAIGIGWEGAKVAAFEPAAHDFPMDFVVTEKSIYQRTDKGLIEAAPGVAAASLARRIAGLSERRAPSP